MTRRREREAEFVAEVRRIQERYAVEVIERFDICPWARSSRQGGDLRRPILLQPDDALGPTLDLIAALEDEPEPPAVAIATYPFISMKPPEFDRFAARIREADQARHRGAPQYVSATFHPDYALDDATPARLVTYFRRSPDPSLQLVRLSVLEQARGTDRGKFVFDYSPEALEELMRRTRTIPVSERIARDNHAMLQREGSARLEEIFADIRDDRARTYAAFADLHPGPRSPQKDGRKDEPPI